MIKAVIYDVDGTLVNSEEVHLGAWDKALQEYGHHLIDLSPTVRATMAGKKPTAIAKEIIDDLKLTVDSGVLLDKKTTFFMNSIKSHIAAMPGAVESVKRLSEAGYKLGIGTSSHRSYITGVLDTLGITNHFAAVVTGDEIKNGKPHPDTYLVVVDKLGVNPNECVVLEDAQSGIESAKGAGCFCIAVKDPRGVVQDTNMADETVLTLGEVTTELISSFN